MYSDIIYNVYLQTEGGVGDFVLSNNEKEIPFTKKVCFIDNPLTVNCNDKKMITKLYKEIESIAMEQIPDIHNDLSICLINTLDEYIKLVPYPLQYNYNINLCDVFKLCNLGFPEYNETHLGSLLNYIKVVHRLLDIEVFIFRNLKSFFNEEELLTLYTECNYEKVYLFLIEGCQYERIEYEKCYIIDKDLCFISL